VAVVERSQPFPVPPPEIDADGLKLVVPLVFAGKLGMSSLDIREEIEIGQGENLVNAKLRGIRRGCFRYRAHRRRASQIDRLTFRGVANRKKSGAP
jgi:hypothetical protein